MIIEDDECGDSESEGGDSEGGYSEGGEGSETRDMQTVRYSHSIINSNDGINKIDLNITLDINILEYLIGGIRKIKYVDNTCLDIAIEPFKTNDIIIKNKGLLGGNLNVKLIFKNIILKDWKKISEKKRDRVINIIKKMYA
jgi:hypothetical protein